MNQGTAPHSVNAAQLTTLGPAGEHARRSEAYGSKPFGQGHERFEGHPADRAFHALIGRLEHFYFDLTRDSQSSELG